jgi:Tol biopolymer transport system component
MKTTNGMARASLGAALVLGLFLGGCEGNVNDDTVLVLPIDLVSRSVGGSPADSTCNNPSVSADGTLVAFDTYASNMHPIDNNSNSDVFVRDLASGATYLVSINAAGTGSGNNYSENPRISPDGRFVAFMSTASDLVSVPGFSDTNNNYDIYVHDLWTGHTLPVSVNGAETGMAGIYWSVFPDVVSDSTNVYVVFHTDYDMGLGSTMGTQIYLRKIPIASFEVATLTLAQITSGTTQMVSQDADGADGNIYGSGYSYNAVLALGTPAGSLVYVAWDSDASDLLGAAGTDINGRKDVFVRSVNRATLALGTTVLVSKAFTTAQGGDGDSFRPVISSDGEYVAFSTDAKDLMAVADADINGSQDVYRCGPFLTGPVVMDRISEGDLGQANGDSYAAGISGDGRYVLFSSEASNLVGGDTNNATDVFVKDTWSWTLTRVSLTVFSGQPTSDSGETYDVGGADISEDGASVMFTSRGNILPGVGLFEGGQIYRRKY